MAGVWSNKAHSGAYSLGRKWNRIFWETGIPSGFTDYRRKDKKEWMNEWVSSIACSLSFEHFNYLFCINFRTLRLYIACSLPSILANYCSLECLDHPSSFEKKENLYFSVILFIKCTF